MSSQLSSSHSLTCLGVGVRHHAQCVSGSFCHYNHWCRSGNDETEGDVLPASSGRPPCWNHGRAEHSADRQQGPLTSCTPASSEKKSCWRYPLPAVCVRTLKHMHVQILLLIYFSFKISLVAQAGLSFTMELEMTLNSWPLFLPFPSAEITGRCFHTWFTPGKGTQAFACA